MTKRTPKSDYNHGFKNVNLWNSSKNCFYKICPKIQKTKGVHDSNPRPSCRLPLTIWTTRIIINISANKTTNKRVFQKEVRHLIEVPHSPLRFYLSYFVPLENVSPIQATVKAGLQNLGQCSVPSVLKHGGIFLMPHLLWQRTSGLLVSSEKPDAFHDKLWTISLEWGHSSAHYIYMYAYKFTYYL